MKENSYTAASSYPKKLVQKASEAVKEGTLQPLHIQISPTNTCNLSCNFCSCANRKNSEEMPIVTYKSILKTFQELGCKAVTITGGGEPLLHKDIKEIISYTSGLDLRMGLVTNGTAFGRVSIEDLSQLTWCRISFSDDRKFNPVFIKTIKEVTKAQIDWAFSYVVTESADIENIAGIVDLANSLKFTHVRLVSDLLDLTSVPDMKWIKQELKNRSIDDNLVIYQDRQEYTRGHPKCRVSLVKPVIAADGNLYPCCGVQYALEENSLDFESTMSMGGDIISIYEGQKYFNGSKCIKCYYNNYNELLDDLCSPLDHEEFV